MKKLILLFLLLITSLLSAQQTYVPDDNFEYSLIKMGLDSPPLNDSVPTKNIDTITILNVSQKMIKDLAGIEGFISLKELNCSENQISNLDVSKNANLSILNCSMNILKSLDVSGNSELKHLICFSNELTSIDISNNIKLTLLDIQGNDMENLDLTNNSLLDTVNIAVNKITALHISNLSKLKYLDCSNNHFFSIDVSNNYELTELICFYTDLTGLDISKNTSLKKLVCYGNDLKNIDVSRNKELIYLTCYSNNLTELDVGYNDSLMGLGCSNNPIEVLDLSNNKKLQILSCSNTSITSLDLSKNYSLIRLNCSNNNLTYLNVQNGNNYYMIDWDYAFDAKNNPNLFCIQVDDTVFSKNCSDWAKDKQAHYSTDCGSSGVESELKFQESVSVTPNPASDYIEISYPPSEKWGLGGVLSPAGGGQGVDARIYDILGTKVTSPSLRDTPPWQGGEKVRIDVSAFAPGMYFVRVGDIVKKFVKY